MKDFVIGTLVFCALVLIGLLVSATQDLQRIEECQKEQMVCQETCVYQGKLRVETLTEPPGCYCADYDAIHKVKLGDGVF